MHKKTTKSQRLTKRRLGREPRSGRTTVLQQPRVGSDHATSSGIDGKLQLSSSWSQQLTDERTSYSWSEGIEDAASRRVLEYWRIVERTLHDEEEPLPPGPLFDECVQWRSQLAHLRIVGCGVSEPENRDRKSAATSSKVSSATQKEKSVQKDNSRLNELANLEPDFLAREASFHSFKQPNYKQAREEVLDHIVEFICKELAEIEAEKLAEVQDSLNENFDECLKIAPAPTTTGKNPLVSNNFYHNIESSGTPPKEEKSMVKEKDLQMRRNKLGTVFNERIIVSPVPFIVTTRESFSTLRKTPILYVGEDSDSPNNIRSGSRRKYTRRKLSLTGNTPLIAVPHVQPSWNTPVCPTIWPKNVKLTPIDTSRLPSSKRRPTKTAESLPPRRSRHSLSPISRSVQPMSPRSCNQDNHLEGLEVRGSQIVTQRRNWHPRKNSKSNDLNANLYLPKQQLQN